MKRIVVIGGGFAGLWSAIGAARKLDEQGASNQVEVVMINPHVHHSIRVRNYEADLAATLVPLSDVPGPVGVQWIQGAVTDIDVAGLPDVEGSADTPHSSARTSTSRRADSATA